jgi:hypothetical protein
MTSLVACDHAAEPDKHHSSSSSFLSALWPLPRNTPPFFGLPFLKGKSGKKTIETRPLLVSTSSSTGSSSSPHASNQNSLAHQWPGLNFSSQLNHNLLSLRSFISSGVSFCIAGVLAHVMTEKEWVVSW